MTGAEGMTKCIEAQHNATKIQQLASEKQIKERAGRTRGGKERERVKRLSSCKDCVVIDTSANKNCVRAKNHAKTSRC